MKKLLTLFTLLLTVCSGAWAEDFVASEITTSGTTHNHVTCTSTAGTSANANVCNDDANSYGSGTASMITVSANSNPNTGYIEIKAESGYKLVSPITIHGVIQNNADKAICVVYWEGDYSGTTFSSWENVTFPNRKTVCDNAVTELSFTGTVRTIRLYKQLYINNDGFQSSSGSGKTQGGNNNLGVTQITASATAIVTGDAITLNANGGSANGSGTITANATSFTPTAPTYADHTVDGYYTTSDCKTMIATAAGALQPSVTVDEVAWTDGDSKWVKGGAATFYAHWKVNTPEITCSDNTVTISVPTGSTVYYTDDESTPTSESTAYNTSFTIDATKTIKAIAIQNGCTSSDVASEECAYVTPTCATPTITVDNAFNFANKGYKVTITNTEGETLKVSTDGETYTTQTSPYVTYATNTTHYYAKSVKDGYNDSGIADENVTNTFDDGKKYIAWVYTDDYASKDDVNDKYHFNNDPMVTALQTNYNVVAVNYAASATPSDDLNNADLVVLTEAVSGSAAMTKAMKGFVGNVPMINMKFFAYTNEDARWQWGTPANPGTATTKITPSSKLYKVLNGVTFDGDDISLYSQISSTSKANGIQTVEWLDEPVNFVSSNTDMAVTNSKVSMHAGTKFFGIGLSCDSRSYYNENAFTIIKNAAAMLIAGEDLTTEVATVPVTIGASGYASYCSSYALDFTGTGVTAYTAKVEEEKVVLTKVTDNIVPANEGVVLRGAQNDYNIPVATTDDSFDFSENQMVGVVQRTQVVWNVGGKYNYILQQGQFNMANGGYLKANRAYLSTTYNVEAQGGAKPLTIVFNDEEQGEETDGIKSVQGSGFTVNGEAYNLSGQRVGADYKGLVIINGKKIIRK